MSRPRVMTALLALLLACGGPSPPESRHASVLIPPATAAAAQESSADPGPTRDRVQTECVPEQGSDDDPGPNETYAAGMTAVRQQRYSDALPLLREVYRARCAEQALFLIGVTLDKLGDLDGARRALEHFQDTASSEIGQRRAVLYLACLRRRQQDATVDCLQEQMSAPPP